MQEIDIYPKYFIIYYSLDGNPKITRRINAHVSIVKDTIKHKEVPLFCFEFSSEQLECSVYPFENGIKPSKPIKVPGYDVLSD